MAFRPMRVAFGMFFPRHGSAMTVALEALKLSTRFAKGPVSQDCHTVGHIGNSRRRHPRAPSPAEFRRPAVHGFCRAPA